MKALGEKNDIPILNKLKVFSGMGQTMWLKEGS